MFELMEWFETDYVSGCQTFYARSGNDEWHQAHEDMVAEIKAAPDFDAGNAVVAKYHRVFQKLVARYLKTGPRLRDVRPWGAFYSPHSGLEKLSTEERACIRCWSTVGPFRIIVDQRSKLPSVACKKCVPGREPKVAGYIASATKMIPEGQ